METYALLDNGSDVSLCDERLIDELGIQSLDCQASEHFRAKHSIPRDRDVDKWPHLKGIELPEIDIKEVRALIGCNVPETFWVLEEKRGGKGEPVGIRSPLGWTIIGPTEKIGQEDSFNLEDDDETLSQQVEKFWKTDFVDLTSSSKVSMSVEDQ